MFILLLSLLVWMGNVNAKNIQTNQFVCRAPQTQDNICQINDGFTPITEPDIDLGISNPINIVNGAKILRESDLPESINGLLPFIRFYSSNNTAQNGFGYSWLSNYSITAQKLNNDIWQINFPTGKKFTAHTIKQRNGDIYWQAGLNRSFLFNQKGKLIQLQTPNNGQIKLDYYDDPPYLGYLKSISSDTQSIKLNYQISNQTVLLQSLITDLGIFDYHYYDGYLIKVIRPDGMWRSYQYDARINAKHLITAISINSPQGQTWQIRNWQYDGQNRVTRAWPGKANKQSLIQLSYQPEKTTVKTSKILAQIDYENIAGQKYITQQALKNGQQTNIEKISYDDLGKIKSIDKLNIERYKNGQIKTLKPNYGWPNLSLNYNQQGQLKSWFSSISNNTYAYYHDNGLLQGLLYANGDRLEINPDKNNRPIKISHTSPHGNITNIDLTWHGKQLIKLQNKHETEYLSYDKNQQLNQRSVIRKSTYPISYNEQFTYENDRLIKHNLPEGGQLIYEWLADRLINIKWLDNHGNLHTVIKTVDNKAGYAHGNDLHTQVLQGKYNSWLLLSKHGQLIWGEHRLTNHKNNLIKQSILSDQDIISTNFVYDKHNRTIAYTDHESTQNNMNLLAWADDGRLTAHRKNKTNQNINNLIHRDTSALPIQIGEYQLEYQSQRRLQKIKEGAQIRAQYTYNARGQRIYQKYENHSAHRLYINNRLSALWHIKNGQIINRQRFVYAHNIAVGLIETDANNNSRLYFVHNNQIGAPVIISDASQNIVWQADYDLFGKANIKSTKIDMPLRLPGQDTDPFSGWHDNVFRTYLPNLGQYLEPDPLGPLPGQQAFGYAAQQALRYIDPLGLVLLAFDGTRYSKINHGNVWKLSQIYNDGPSFYHQGPGSSYYLNWDAVTASSSRQIQQNQWQSLLNVLDKAQNQRQTVPIDILGYSRGAALARDFANKIVANTNNGWFNYDDPIRGNIGVCVNLRFLGLFDTVAQFGILGAANAGYDLGIAGSWQWVAHAVASHEFRALFPLVSATQDDSLNAIEVPFIGAHADIGGGMILDDDLQPVINGDLSDVALNWMYWQARAALVTQEELSNNDSYVNQPWLHDERNIIEKSLLSGDRNIQDSSTATIGLQGSDKLIGNQQRLLFEKFITRVNNHPQAGVVGTVDMHAYDIWLQQSLGMPSVLK